MADGARLLQAAGRTMSEVVHAIESISGVMQTIHTHAAAPSEGVAQVHSAVASLDQMAQQNATLVEQRAAAAHRLHAQSEQLR